MWRAALVGCTLLACGCAARRDQVEVRYVVVREPPLRAPPADVPPLPVQYTPPPPHARSISLGFIGDWPLDRYPAPPAHDPPWARPFPCNWTGTCGCYPSYDPATLRTWGYPADYPR